MATKPIFMYETVGRKTLLEISIVKARENIRRIVAGIKSNPEWFFSSSPPYLGLFFQPLISRQTGFQLLELDSLVNSNTDDFELLLIQRREDLNMMWAESAGVTANSE